MKKLEMEVLICEELIKKIQNGDFKGRKVVKEIQSGNYLKNLECEKIDPKLFNEAAKEANEKLQNEINKAIENANFVTRRLILNVKFGNKLADDLLIDGLNNRVKEIYKLLEKEKKSNPSKHIPDKHKTSITIFYKVLGYLNPFPIYHSIKKMFSQFNTPNTHKQATDIEHGNNLKPKKTNITFHELSFPKHLRKNIRMDKETMLQSMFFADKLFPTSSSKKKSLEPSLVERICCDKLLEKLSNQPKSKGLTNASITHH